MKTITAVRAIILCDTKVLLVKHKGSSFFALPGGKVDLGERLEEALKRELKEELGVDAKIGDLLFIQQFEYREKMNLEFFFFIKNGNDFLHALGGSHTELELESIDWVDIESNYAIMPEFLTEEIKKIAKNKGVQPMQFISR